MWKAKLRMNVNSSDGISEEEKIRILHEVGFDGFFTLWVPEKIAVWRELADELGMEYAFGFKDHSPTQAGIINFGKVIDAAERLGVKIAFENTEGEEYLSALMDAFKAGLLLLTICIFCHLMVWLTGNGLQVQ